MFLFGFLALISATSKGTLPKLFEECTPGTVVADCETTNKDYTKTEPLTETFQSFIMNANIKLVSCTFKKFTSTTAGASIIAVTESSAGKITFLGCTFQENNIVAPLISLEGASANFTNSHFLDNTVQGALLLMKGAHFTFTHCTFVDNVAESSIGMKSFISAKSNSQVTVASCCFFTQQKGGHTIETEDNSKLIFEGNSATFFNCAADLAFNQNDATIENPSNVLFTQTECRIPLEEQSTTGEQDDDSNSSTGGDDENPGDEEKKITRYVYIGIGALAIAVVIAIVVFLCFRISGKCKKFEQKSEGELNDIGDKRDSYLLQEADGEIQETEL